MTTCSWEDHDLRDANGKRRVECESCGYVTKTRTAVSLDKVRRPQCPGYVLMTAFGVGSQLAAIFSVLGAKQAEGCKCPEMIRKMNAWGPTGCRKHMDEIVSHLNKAYSSLTWTEAGAIGLRTAALGLPLTTRGLVELAIARAEAPSST